MAAFTCVTDARVPATTCELLRAACDERAIAYVEVLAADFDYAPGRRLTLGDMLYRPATTIAAARTEQFLYAPGVATFYADSGDRPFFVETAQALHFERAGLLVPPTVYCASANRALLKSWVAQLGGYPVLAKMGGQGGVGVIMIESYAGLCSFVDFALHIGRSVNLSAYIAGAVHWRVVVVGDRPVAAYTCQADPGDFRAVWPGEHGVITADPPAAVAARAVEAVRVSRLEFGGVDLLERDDEVYVLESNFPCYFPHAQVMGGIDVAGAMIEHLRLKAERFLRAGQSGG